MNKGINILVSLSLLCMSSLSSMAAPCGIQPVHGDCCCSEPALPVVEVVDSCCADENPMVPIENACDCSFDVPDSGPLVKGWQVAPNFNVAHTLLALQPTEVLLTLPETANLSAAQSTSPPDYRGLVPTYRTCLSIRC